LYFIKSPRIFLEFQGKILSTESGDKMNDNKKKNLSKDEEVIEAYKSKDTYIKSDVNGSYTGLTENYEVPEQDADDL
jgi:hypothetical protein